VKAAVALGISATWRPSSSAKRPVDLMRALLAPRATMMTWPTLWLPQLLIEVRVHEPALTPVLFDHDVALLRANSGCHSPPPFALRETLALRLMRAAHINLLFLVCGGAGDK